jgi:hypothetical protein
MGSDDDTPDGGERTLFYGIMPSEANSLLTSIINATCPGHQEQVKLMLSKFPPF